MAMAIEGMPAVAPLLAGGTIRYRKREECHERETIRSHLGACRRQCFYAADSSGPASRADPMMDRYNAAAERQD